MKPDLDITLAAHNGVKFDFPLLMRECIRAGIAPVDMAAWVYVDTLDFASLGSCGRVQEAAVRLPRVQRASQLESSWCPGRLPCAWLRCSTYQRVSGSQSFQVAEAICDQDG